MSELVYVESVKNYVNAKLNMCFRVLPHRLSLSLAATRLYSGVGGVVCYAQFLLFFHVPVHAYIDGKLADKL